MGRGVGDASELGDVDSPGLSVGAVNVGAVGVVNVGAGVTLVGDGLIAVGDVPSVGVADALPVVGDGLVLIVPAVPVVPVMPVVPATPASPVDDNVVLVGDAAVVADDPVEFVAVVDVAGVIAVDIDV